MSICEQRGRTKLNIFAFGTFFPFFRHDLHLGMLPGWLSIGAKFLSLIFIITK
jgi:hypothetical protein